MLFIAFTPCARKFLNKIQQPVLLNSRTILSVVISWYFVVGGMPEHTRTRNDKYPLEVPLCRSHTAEKKSVKLRRLNNNDLLQIIFAFTQTALIPGHTARSIYLSLCCSSCLASYNALSIRIHPINPGGPHVATHPRVGPRTPNDCCFCLVLLDLFVHHSLGQLSN